MRAILSLVFLGGLWAVGYVLFNGVDGLYELFGADGPVLSGGALIAAGLAASGGVVCLNAGIRPVEVPFTAPDGHIEVQTTRQYRVGYIVIGVILGVVASALLISGMD
jgi:hypothetical protein